MLFEMFHDQGKDYISNIEPEKDEAVSLRLRTTRDAVKEAYIFYTINGDNWIKVPMENKGIDQTGYYEFFEGTVPPIENKYYYCFMADGTYLSGMGTGSELPTAIESFVIMPGFKTPDWAKGILWYSIMPDPFFNGDILNDSTETGLRKTVPWGAALRGLFDYYGGDIAGIKSKLDYIKEFHPDGIYVNPLWTSESNAGYGPNSYFETSVNYGNEEEFIDLIKTTHDKGLRFLMDAVFSYSQDNSIYTNSNGHQPLPGAFESQDSEYYDMFEFKKWPYEYTHKWGGIENDLGSDKSRDLFWRGKDSVLHRYASEPYNADGYRFDAITSFAGHDTDLTEIGRDIRENMKDEFPEVVLIGEDYGTDRALSANWDAFQNSFFLFSAKLWFNQGQFDQSWLLERLSMLAKLPRPLGLCLYNNYDLHDVQRLINDYETEKYKIKGVWLLQMTYVGSPVIYYGDEMGCKKEVGNSRNCFNWNQADWNQELLALSKTLGKLRTEYTALKDGLFKVGLTDNERQITVFGRWDENGNVVTMLNQRDYDQDVVLDLKQYNIVDGTVLTDYLTGHTYTVENGCAQVIIPAGGSILVTGNAGDYRSTMKLLKEEYRDYVKMPEENTFVIKEYSENIEASMPIFGQGYIETAVYDSNCEYNDINKECGGYIFIGDGEDGKRVTAHIGNRWVTIRDTEGHAVYETEVPKDSRVRIAMTQNGMISLSVNGGLIKEDICSLVRTEKLYAGIIAQGNNVIFENVQVSNGSASLYDDFEMGDLQNLLSTYKAKGEYKVADGMLHMKSKEASLLLTDEHPHDYTFKTRLADGNEGFAGIVSYCDDNNAIVLGREADDVIFGYLRNDEVISWDIMRVNNDEGMMDSGDMILQLQRVGNVYQAIYEYNGVMKQFPTPIMANMSIVRAGLVCIDGSADFDFACFGNSIMDEHTTNTPVTLNSYDWHEESEKVDYTRKVEQYNIIGDMSEWEYAHGGIRRKVAEGLSQMAITNKVYRNFKAQGTLLRDGGDGEIGMTFLRSSIDENLGDGYVLSLSASDVLTLKYQEQVIASKQIEVSQYGLRVTIIRVDNRLYIYIGQDREIFAQLDEVKVESGYIGFYMQDVCGHINNRMVADYAPLWLEPTSPWAHNMATDEKGFVAKVPELTMGNIRGGAYTNVEARVRVMLSVCDDSKEAYAGLLFGATQDIEPARGGVLVALDKEGNLVMSKKGEVKCSYAMNTGVASAMFKVRVVDGLYEVYLPYEREAVLSWQDDEFEGGVLSLVSLNSKSGFYHLEVQELTQSLEPMDEAIFDMGIQDDGEYNVYRNGVRIPCDSKYEILGEDIITIETGLKDDGKYILEMDVTVENPENDKSYPTIFFRTGMDKKLGAYSGSDGSKLVGAGNGCISDVAAEPLWNFGTRIPGETWHVTMETEVNKATVKINGSYLVKNVTLNDCLSGDHSNLAFVPEIVCRNVKNSRTVISDISIKQIG